MLIPLPGHFTDKMLFIIFISNNVIWPYGETWLKIQTKILKSVWKDVYLMLLICFKPFLSQNLFQTQKVAMKTLFKKYQKIKK